jgi:ATP-dependent DNA helicase
VKHLQPKILDGGTMRHYQLVGMNWLISLYENGVSGILADEMGLGKTIQTISLLAHLYEKNIKGPFLIVAPLSTLSNWKNEVARFAPKISAILYHGSKQDRARMRAVEVPKLTKKVPELSILITSYEISMKDARYLRRIPFKYLIVDEAHRLKNFNCKLTRDLKTYTSENRLLLTGTPLQNNLTELWSLLNFLIPDLFDDLDNFRKWFDFTDKSEDRTLDEEKPKLINKLHNILRPFILRRLKNDVELDLPTKKEYLMFAPMVPIQREYYQAIKDKDLSPILERCEDSESARSTRLVNILMQLRKVCNHPYLITEFQSNANETVDQANKRFISECVSNCGKFKLLHTMLLKLKERGHKVLIFSLMTRMLDVLEDYLEVLDVKYCRLDGSVQQVVREERIKQFNEDPEVFCFLLSTRAGGLGINLTAADTVIIYDSDWNPQIDLQAQDRCHRIGQTKPVRVFRLLTTNSVERKIWQTAQKKLQLEKLIIHKGNFKGAASKGKKITLTATSLMEILAHSDDNREEESHQKGVSNEDLDALLDRTREDLVSGEGYEVVNYDRENFMEWNQTSS